MRRTFRVLDSLTAVMMPEGHDADRFRATVLETFDMSLGAGLGQFAGRAFRIGHLGAFNDLMLAGTLSGVEMGLRVAGVPHRPGGVIEALNVLASASALRSRDEPHRRRLRGAGAAGAGPNGRR